MSTTPVPAPAVLLDLPSFLSRGGAVCASAADPDLWHRAGVSEVAAAKRLCASCPLLAACRSWAVGAGEQHGVWGGLDAADRRRLASGEGWWLDDRGRVRRPCGTETAARAHRGFGEPVCGVCAAAHEARITAQRRALLAEAHREWGGGSRAGAKLHRLLGEPVCDRCRRAVAAASRAARARRAATGPLGSTGGDSLATGLPGPQRAAQAS